MLELEYAYTTNWTVRVIRVFYEGNHTADWLASQGMI